MSSVKRSLAVVSGALALALSACATPAADPPITDPRTAHGQSLARQHCSACHAIGRADQSRMRDAIPFRNLSQLYPVADLAESLVEGLMTGHPDMPEFRFSTEAANDLIRFMESIQAE